ncbi:MAG: hypothetical protein ACREIR_19550 [Geminicoccaceae bacterium]
MAGPRGEPLSGCLQAHDDVLCRAAVAGIGLTIQPSCNVWRELRSGRWRSFSTKGVEALGAWVALPRRQFLPSEVRGFAGFLAAAAATIWLCRAQNDPETQPPGR